MTDGILIGEITIGALVNVNPAQIQQELEQTQQQFGKRLTLEAQIDSAPFKVASDGIFTELDRMRAQHTKVGQAGQTAQEAIVSGLKAQSAQAAITSRLSVEGQQKFTRAITETIREIERQNTALGSTVGKLGMGGSGGNSTITRLSTEAIDAARGLDMLTKQLERGAIARDQWNSGAQAFLTVLEQEGQAAGTLSREMQMFEQWATKISKIQARPVVSLDDRAALDEMKALEQNARRSAQTIAAAWKTEMATARQAVTGAMNLRQDWQNGKVTDSGALQRLEQMRAGYIATQEAIQGQIAKLTQLGVLDEQQTKRVQVLEQQYRAYGNAVRNLGSIEASIQGTIQKGSLADSMARGVTEAERVKVAAAQASEAVRLLQAQEQAGLITKGELSIALQNETLAQKAALTATQERAAALRTLGVLDVQQTEELAALTAAELRYTETLGRTVVAQEAAARSSSVLRQGMGMAGGRGAGMNNALMAASFVSPELGMVGMAASMGPAVAGVTAVAMGVKKVVDLTKDGQEEAKKWQQAFLVMSANGIKDLGAVAKSINDITINGSQAEKMFSKAELAQAMAELARGGVKGAEALKTVAVSAQLAAAEHVPLNKATELLYANLQHLGMGGDQAASFGDKLARASHMSLASMDNLSKGMNVVGMTAHELGYSVDETLAMLVSLAKKGMDPATIGSTGLRNAMQMAIKPGKDAANIYAELGVKLQDSTGHARSGRDILMDLQKVMSSTGPVYNQLTGEILTKNDLAEKSFHIFGTRSATAFLGTLGNLRELTDEVKDSEGFLDHYSNDVVSGLEGSQKRLDAATKNLSLTFAKTFTPMLSSAADLATTLITKLDPLAQKLTGVFDKLNGIKNLGDIKTTLTVQAGDSNATALLKFLAGGAVQVGTWAGKAVDVAGGVVKAASTGMNAIQLMGALHEAGLIQDTHSMNGNAAQLEAIKADMPKYQKMLDDFMAAQGKMTGALNSLEPKAMLPQPLRGAGPLLPGESRGNVTTAGNLASEIFIKGMTQSVHGDPRINAWCADVVSQMLSQLGYSVKRSVNARQLEQNVKAAGGQVIPLSQARQGDVVFYHGIDPSTGRPYGASSGTHVEMGAGWKNGQFQLVGSNTSPTMTGKGIYDVRQATIYRLPGGMLFSDGGPANDKPAPEETTASHKPKIEEQAARLSRLQAEAQHLIAQVAAAHAAGNGAWLSKAENAVKAFKKASPDAWNTDLQKMYAAATKGSTASPAAGELKELTAQLSHLKAQYDAHKITLDQYHASAEKVRTQALALQGTLKEGSALWSAADRVVISASSAVNLHAKAAENASLTYAQWNKNRAEATRLAKLESDLSDGKLGDKAAIDARRQLDRYRKDPVQGAALEEAERRLRLQQQRQEEASRQQQQNARELERQEAESARARADIARSLRDQNLELAKQTTTGLKNSLQRQQEDAGEDAQKRLALARHYAPLIRQAQENEAAVTLRNENAAADNGPAQLRKGARQLAQQHYQEAMTAAVSESAKLIDDANEKAGQKVSQLRDKYSSLADSMREKIATGKVESKDLTEYLGSLAKLNTESDKVGLSQNKFIQGAQQSAAALYQAGIDASIASGAYDDVEDSVSRLTGAHGKVRVALEDAVAGVPTAIDQWDSYIQVMTELDGQGKLAAGTLQAVKDRVAELRSEAQREDIVIQLQVEAEGKGINPDASFDPLHDRDAFTTPASQMDLKPLLGDTQALVALWKQLGGGNDLPDAVAAQFTPDRFADLGTDVLQGLIQGLSGNPEWDKVVQAMQEGLGKAADITQLVNRRNEEVSYAQPLGTNRPDEHDTLDTPTSADDSAAAYDTLKNGLQDMTDAELALIKADQVFMADQDLKNAVIAEQTRRVEANKQALRDLPGILAQIDLNKLERNHTPGKGDEAYIAERTRLETVLENAQWEVQKKSLTGQALENAEKQHQDRLADIVAKGLADRTKLETDASSQAADATEALHNAQLALAQVQGMKLPSYHSEIESLEQLKIKYPEIAKDLDELIKKYKELAAVQDKWSDLEKLGAGFQKLFGGLGTVFKSFGADGLGAVADETGNLIQNLTQMPKAINDVRTAFSTFKSAPGLASLGGLAGSIGGVLGVASGVTNAIFSIGNAIEASNGKLNAWKKNLREVADLEKQRMGSQFIGGTSGINGIENPYYKQLSDDAASREQLAGSKWYQRAWWGLTGGGPKHLSDEAAKALSKASAIFNEFGQSLYGSLESALMNAFDSGDFSGATAALEKTLNTMVAKMALQTLIASSKLKDHLKQLADDQAAGRDISNDVALIKNDMQSIQQGWQAMAPSLPGYGAGADQSASSGSSGNLFGNAPGVQLGVPHIEVTLPPDTFKPLSDLADVIPRLDTTLDRLTTVLDKGLDLSAPAVQLTLPDSVNQSFALFSSAAPVFAAGAADLRLGSGELREVVADWRAFMRSGAGIAPKLSPQGGLT